jgi:hypothetical protein
VRPSDRAQLSLYSRAWELKRWANTGPKVYFGLKWRIFWANPSGWIWTDSGGLRRRLSPAVFRRLAHSIHPQLVHCLWNFDSYPVPTLVFLDTFASSNFWICGGFTNHDIIINLSALILPSSFTRSYRYHGWVHGHAKLPRCWITTQQYMIGCWWSCYTPALLMQIQQWCCTAYVYVSQFYAKESRQEKKYKWPSCLRSTSSCSCSRLWTSICIWRASLMCIDLIMVSLEWRHLFKLWEARWHLTKANSWLFTCSSGAPRSSDD